MYRGNDVKNTLTRAQLHIRSRKMKQRIAQVSISFAAFVTIAVLFLIIGFILLRGFYSSNIKNYKAITAREHGFSGLMLVVNESIRIKDMQFASIVDMVTGEHIDWGKLSEQEYELVPCLIEPGTSAGADVLDALGVSMTDVTPMAVLYPNSDSALKAVSTNQGGFAVVPEDAQLPKKTKRIDVMRVAIAVNPAVAELVGNTKLQILDEQQLKDLFSGCVSNWQTLGGLDLPVTVLAPPSGSALSELAKAQGLLEVTDACELRILETSSTEEQIRLLETTSGAVTLLYYADAVRSQLPILNYEHVETGPNLTLDFILEAPKMSGRVGGISTIIINTLIMIVLTLLIATPIGVSAAIYLMEYARQGRLVYILRLGTETLAGIPSIIFGLFGMIFFVNILGWGIGLVSGVLTLTLMILPTIVRTSEEALKSVPLSMREGSLALGATKLQTVMKVSVPAAMPGILTGVILSLGRAVGETAALVFTMGSNYEVAANLFSSARVLAVHIYLIVAEGISMDKAFATATILIFIILFVNLATTRIIGRFNTMAGKN